MAERNKFPLGWNETKVKAVLVHYEEQTDDEAAAEDEAALRARGQTVMVVPQRLVPAITKLITRQRTVALRKRSKKGVLPTASRTKNPPASKACARNKGRSL